MTKPRHKRPPAAADAPAVPEGIGVLLVEAASGRLVYANPRLRALFGFRPGAELQLDDLAGRCAELCDGRRCWESLAAAETESSRDLVLDDGRLLRHFVVPLLLDGPARVAHLFEDVTDRRRSETALRQSEARLQAYFDGARDAILTADVASGRIVAVNAEAERLFRRPREELIGLHQADLHPPEMRDKYIAQFRQYAGGTPFGVEAWIITGDGQRVLCEVNASVIELDGGGLALQGIFRDISARLAAEAALRESEARYRQMFENNRAVQLLVDPDDGRIVDANAAAAAFYGSSRDELRGMAIQQINLLQGSALQQALEAAQGGEMLPPFQHRVASGEIRDVQVFSSPVVIRGRTFLHSIIQDVTASRRAERALRASEQRYRSLFEEARDAILIADPGTGLILDANPFACQLLGRAREQLLGMHQSELHPPHSRDEARAMFADHARRGTSTVAETLLLTATGEEVPVEISASPLELPNGQRAVLGIFRDSRERRRADQARAEMEQVYRQMFQTNLAVKLLIDPESGEIVDANPAAAQFYGYPLERLKGMNIRQINLLPGEEVEERMQRAREGGRRVFQFRHRLAGGDVRDVEVYTGPVTVAGRECLHSIVQDVTERNRQAQLQAARGRILELIARARPLDETLRELARLAAAQLPGTQVAVLLAREGRLLPAELHQAGDDLRQALAHQSLSLVVPSAEEPAVLSAAEPGARRDVLEAARLAGCWSMPVLDRQDTLLGALELYFEHARRPQAADLALLRELTRLTAVAIEQRQLADALVHQAQHDALTGLPNRSLLRDRLEQAVRHAARVDEVVAVMLLDLDDFKLVNDSLGHSAGDRLLEEVAQRLRTCVRPDDTVARLGGDEFVLILSLARAEDANLVADKVLQALTPSYRIAGHELHTLPSIGISLFPQDGRTPEVLLQSADTAMYAAKYAGKHRYHYFAEGMNLEVTERLTLESELRQALTEQQFELYFQPRVAVGEERVLGAEALLRWHHPRRGLLAPGAFLGVAEQSHLIEEIDAWVFRTACRQMADWQARGLDLSLSVNLSAGQLHAPGLALGLVSVLEEHGVAADRLEVEITESMLMKDISRAIEQLRELKRMAPGIRIAIDDFGSGYSSLNYLRRLPIDTLKIDRAFVVDLADTGAAESALAIIKTVVDLGHNLGLRVLAEGIETAEQAAAVAGIGCHEAQGYWFDKPLALADFEARLRHG